SHGRQDWGGAYDRQERRERREKDRRQGQGDCNERRMGSVDPTAILIAPGLWVDAGRRHYSGSPGAGAAVTGLSSTSRCHICSTITKSVAAGSLITRARAP